MIRERSGWTKVKIGKNHFVSFKPIDPEIQAQMPPPGSKTFLEVGPIELLIHDIKQALHPDRKIQY